MTSFRHTDSSAKALDALVATNSMSVSEAIRGAIIYTEGSKTTLTSCNTAELAPVKGGWYEKWKTYFKTIEEQGFTEYDADSGKIRHVGSVLQP